MILENNKSGKGWPAFFIDRIYQLKDDIFIDKINGKKKRSALTMLLAGLFYVTSQL